MKENEEVRLWLEKYGAELEPEELVSEEEKQTYAFCISWPTPQEIPDLGIFEDINSQTKFNCIVGDPANWSRIREDTDLFEKWIAPHATNIFGKSWFDRVKWAPSISRSAPFPLFAQSDKSYAQANGIPLEKTPMGQTRISQIVGRVVYSLRTYLRADWYRGDTIKPPSGYIYESINNDLIRKIAAELNYKLKIVPACPMCLSRNRKTEVHRHSNWEVSCDVCEELCKNLELNANNLANEGKFSEAATLFEQFMNVKEFIKFSPITCVCPKCSSCVPLSCGVKSVESLLCGETIPKNLSAYKVASTAVGEVNLKCPFCNSKFRPRTTRLGKKKERMLTGLPTVSRWQKLTESLDQPNLNGQMPRDLLVSTSSAQEDFEAKQRIQVLVDELVLKMSRIRTNNIKGLTNWCFFEAAILWMQRYWQDASSYLFGAEYTERQLTLRERVRYPGRHTKGDTMVKRGRDGSIHQTIFQIWLGILETNISRFQKLDPSIKHVSDFVWFARQPKFTGGPESTFRAVVESSKVIRNASPILEVDAHYKPRMAKVISIYPVRRRKVDRTINFSTEIKTLEWHSITLNQQSQLRVGEKVEVSVLLMSGHPTHAPIQRILRLRSSVLRPIVNKIIQEESGEKEFNDFWKFRNVSIQEAYKKVGHLLSLGEEYGKHR